MGNVSPNRVIDYESGPSATTSKSWWWARHVPIFCPCMCLLYIIMFNTSHNKSMRICTNEIPRLDLYTYSLLHASNSHLIFNVLGTLLYGGAIEANQQTFRVVIVHTLSVLSGGFSHFWECVFTNKCLLRTQCLRGASGGVYGLVGSYISYVLYNHHIDDGTLWFNIWKYMYPTLFFAFLISDNVVMFVFKVKNASYWAHVCGFIGGLLSGVTIYKQIDNSKKISRCKCGLRIVGFVMLVGFMIASIVESYKIVKKVHALT